MSNKPGDNIEDQEKYQIHGRGEIMQKLRMLGKSNSMITAYFGGGEYSLLTLVVDVMADKNLLVLDYGANETMNQKLLQNNRAVLSTNHQGIRAQFSISNIQKAKLQGKACFACPIPDALLWVQRREFYRVRVPLSEQVVVELTNSDGEKFLFPVLDISLGGIALSYTDQAIELDASMVFSSCNLKLGNHAEGHVSLELRNVLDIGNDKRRVGCLFAGYSGDMQGHIQRFIHHVEALLKRVES